MALYSGDLTAGVRAHTLTTHIHTSSRLAHGASHGQTVWQPRLKGRGTEAHSSGRGSLSAAPEEVALDVPPIRGTPCSKHQKRRSWAPHLGLKTLARVRAKEHARLGEDSAAGRVGPGLSSAMTGPATLSS